MSKIETIETYPDSFNEVLRRRHDKGWRLLEAVPFKGFNPYTNKQIDKVRVTFYLSDENAKEANNDLDTGLDDESINR